MTVTYYFVWYIILRLRILYNVLMNGIQEVEIKQKFIELYKI